MTKSDQPALLWRGAGIGLVLTAMVPNGDQVLMQGPADRVSSATDASQVALHLQIRRRSSALISGDDLTDAERLARAHIQLRPELTAFVNRSVTHERRSKARTWAIAIAVAVLTTVLALAADVLALLALENAARAEPQLMVTPFR
jgi:hypothetical protein